MQNPNFGYDKKHPMNSNHQPPKNFTSIFPAGADVESELPTSLPSYLPTTTTGAVPNAENMFPFGYTGVIPQPQVPTMAKHELVDGRDFDDLETASDKRHAPIGQWKTPPQFLYAANPRNVHSSKLDSGQKSPSSAMRGMSFSDIPQVYPVVGSDPTDKLPSQGQITTTMTSKAQSQNVAGISAAQFAAGTGGLTMDTNLLARVSGTDPSRMGSEEIKQIMRCPDLLSIYQKLQEEDDRRQRRLERNRASARVRREKKKGMVETYEGEVSKLEYSLNLLNGHKFGVGKAHDLVNALEYNAGEHQRHAMMSIDAKMELMGRILDHHTNSATATRNLNLENEVLIAAAVDNSELFISLRKQLGLTDDQCQRLDHLAAQTIDEAHKLEVIRKCFSALRVHDWLNFPGTEALLQSTRSTMTPQQFQKFLSWTVENKSTIDRLQVVASSSPSLPNIGEDLAFSFIDE